jgi:hypothetical protein
VYNANLRQIGAGDTLPARYLPLGIWRFGTLKLDAIARWVAHGHPSVAEWKQMPPADASVLPWAYWIVRGRQQHPVSFYPVVTPLLVAPLYLPAVLYLDKHRWQQPEVDRVAEAMEKFSASLLAALASVLVYVLLRRDASRWSLAVALAFAFGTNTWMTSSQALWQHGAGELLIALALLLAVSLSTPPNAVALGAVCVFIAANRPPDALLAGAIALHAMWTRRRAAPWLLAGAVIPLAAFLLFNIGVIGSVAGGYGKIDRPAISFFQHSVWEGVGGLLVSPTRGLLVFTPFLIFVPLGLAQRLRASGTRSLALALSVAAIVQFLVYSRMDWRAGISWGPRYMTDMLPVLVWMLAPAPLVLQPLGRALLVLTVAASVFVQGIGAFWYTGTSDEKIFAGDPTSMRAAWDFANVPFLTELRHRPARGELQCNTATAVEHIGATLQPVPGGTPALLAPGSLLEGWALACGRTPAELFLLIDGVAIGATQTFLARPDVDAAMHTKSPSGWRVLADMRGVRPGERVLQVALRVEPRSDIRIVREQRVIVVAQEPSPAQAPASATGLDAMADHAAAVLRGRQSAAGYWLTSYTSGTQFEAPQAEMNTFLTAMMVDFLSPIAREHSLDETVERARLHLTAQIESNGLVRYHGLPNAPTINTLGYVITPDADDTALAWRIAGGNAADARREPMLKELAAYRDSRGLYRTWLAPREQYQSLNPGRDPNPADATIQMHVYLMLRELDPPAAKNLCVALQRSVNDDDLWVYYAKAPLIPFLRSAELRQRDCAVPLPTDRLAHCAAGQEVWSEVARRLVATMVSPPSTTDRQAMFDLLVRIGSDDFAELRRTPPLLYHNDLTATVPRYYWSEDFGYALWLRLYDAARSEAILRR